MTEPAAGNAAISPRKLMPLRTLRRRRRIWRNAAFILVITFIMGLLSAAERDNQTLRGSVQRCHDDLEYARQELQAEFDQGRPAPTTLPLPEIPEPPNMTPAEREDFEQRLLDRRLRYIYLVGHRAYATAGRPALVCQDVQMHNLYMRPDELHLILFDGRHYELRTLHRQDLPQMTGLRGWTPPK
jgi:hypothetical protein